jgi:hypothetical protein
MIVPQQLYYQLLNVDRPSQENCKVKGEGVRSMFSASDSRKTMMLAGRKMDQTPTLQLSC